MFSVPKGAKLHSLNVTSTAHDVASISFNQSATLLGITSLGGALEVYQLVKTASRASKGKNDHRFRSYG